MVLCWGSPRKAAQHWIQRTSLTEQQCPWSLWNAWHTLVDQSLWQGPRFPGQPTHRVLLMLGTLYGSSSFPELFKTILFYVLNQEAFFSLDSLAIAASIWRLIYWLVEERLSDHFFLNVCPLLLREFSVKFLSEKGTSFQSKVWITGPGVYIAASCWSLSSATLEHSTRQRLVEINEQMEGTYLLKLKNPGSHLPVSLDLFLLKEFLTDVTRGCFLNVFQEGPLNHVENNWSKSLFFAALNQCHLLGGNVYTWGKETITML